MALVLGPELDVFLRGIGEDLKGKTILEEPYVDKKTIVRAVSEQNKVILALQTQLLQMQEIEKVMQTKMSMMQEKLTYFEKYTEKVDAIECILREKIPVVDQLNEKVDAHHSQLDRLSMDVKKNEEDVDAFKDETRVNMIESRKEIDTLRNDVELIPDSIIISSRQVTHNLNDEQVFGNSNSSHDHGNDILADIIAQQEQHSVVQDENIERIEQKIDDQVVNQCVCNDKMKKDISCLVDWKHAQSSVDLQSMRGHIDSLQLELENHETVLSKKMSKCDVDKKLEHQFNEIVDHLQTALSSIENEEADFKTITDSLSKMCESLRESKADKSEITSLRRQFITNQVGGSRGTLTGSTLDNEGIRKILSKYATKDEVFKLFDICDDIDSSESPVVGKIHSKIDNLQKIVLKLESMVSNGLKELEKSTDSGDFEERSHPEDSRPSKRKATKQKDARHSKSENNSNNLNDMNISGNSNNLNHTGFGRNNSNNLNKIRSSKRKAKQKDFSHYKTEDLCIPENNISDMNTSGKNSDNFNHSDFGRSDSNTSNRDDLLFPSSSVLNGVLHNALQRIDETPHIITPRKTLIRPSSAPLSNEHPQPIALEKKHSLPAILTSISKTMRPRSKMKSKDKIGKIIHKGSFQVITDNSLKLGKSSDHFLSPLSSSEMGRPKSSEKRFFQKKHGYLIRTSIE